MGVMALLCVGLLVPGLPYGLSYYLIWILGAFVQAKSVLHIVDARRARRS